MTLHRTIAALEFPAIALSKICPGGLGINNLLLVVAAGSSGHRFSIFSKVGTKA